MGGLQFNAMIGNHTVIMDAPERVGGQDLGPIPKPLVLSALSVCTGMDVVALLKKKGVMLKSLHVNVEGELTNRPPIAYQAIQIAFVAECQPSEIDALVGAIELSQKEICGISAMLQKIMPVTWTLQVNGKAIIAPQSEALIMG